MGKVKIKKPDINKSSKPATKDVNLDDIFNEAKKKRDEAKVFAAKEQVKESSTDHKPKESSIESTSSSNYGRIFSKIKVDPKITNPEAPIHRWDKESGLPVYKAAALKAFTEESGGTADCPFDCNCCF